MLGALRWLVALLIGALLPSAVQATALEIAPPDRPLVGGVVALFVAVLVGYGACQLLSRLFASTDSPLVTLLWVSAASAFVIGLSMAVGAAGLEVLARVTCREWMPLSAVPVRDLIGLFLLPTASVALALATIFGSGRYEGRPTTPVFVALAASVRLVAFLSLVLVAGLLGAYVEGFAGSWPEIVVCPSS